MIGIFNNEETAVSEQFDVTYKKESYIFQNLLSSYSSTIEENSIPFESDTQYKRSVALLFVQNVSLLDNAFKLLTLGYIRSSEIILRTISESIILATFFTEFPEAEKEYKSLPHQDFFHKYKVEKMLKKVHTDGTIFVKNKTKEKNLHKNLYNYLYEDASIFSHNDLDVLNGLSLADGNKPSDFIIGPQIYKESLLSKEIQRIIFTALASYLTYCMAFNIENLDDKKMASIDIASKFIDENLNS